MIEWSLALKKEEKILINAYGLESLTLAKAIYKVSLKMGAYPYIDYKVDDLSYFFYNNASDKQLNRKPEIDLFLAKWADKIVSLVAENNAFELASANPKKIMTRTKAVEQVKNIVLQKSWVLTYLPTASMAQNARLSLDECRQLYFDSTVQDYAKMSQNIKKVKKLLDRIEEIHIVGEKTDLKLYFKGRRFQVCDGQYNIPDGEIFSAPLETRTKGRIYFDFPSLRQGKLVKDAYFEFDKGRVLSFDASENKPFLKASLEIDSGAKRLGEFAFGLNYSLTNFMYNTLFDEKLGGTVHLALGSAYPPDEDGGGLNKSAIHWDFVKDMRKAGSKIYGDGKLIFKEGKILF